MNLGFLKIGAAAPLVLVLCSAVFASQGGGGGHGLLAAVGVSVVAATVLGWLAHLARIPLLLAYIAAGVVVGPRMGLSLVGSQGDVEIISEIGLVLLLFLIGLELDLKKLRASGASLLAAGLTQFPLSAVLALGTFSLLGFAMGAGNYDLLYLALCLSLSSTAIVVKLLHAKAELDTLAGRITLGILVFQDIWAIVVLGIQPNLADPQISEILLSFAKGGVLVLIAFLLSRYLLGALFARIAKQPELVLIASLGWCFFICSLAAQFGLSMEMGALIAGAAISTFPYNTDVVAKIINIRDFFVTLFFVALGMKIPNLMANPALLGMAAIAAAFVIVSRLLVLFPLLSRMGNGHRVGLLVSLNLSQVSEFSLVIVALGASLGHVGEELLSLVIFTFVLTSIASTYLIQFNHPLQRRLAHWAEGIGFRDRSGTVSAPAESVSPEVVVLGFHRTASALLSRWEDARSGGNGILAELWEHLMVVDFNPEVHRELRRRGLRTVYGDIAHADTLHHAGLHHARLILCTLPDAILQGTNNLKLYGVLRAMAPKAFLVMTAQSTQQAAELYAAGADLVLEPRQLEAEHLLEVLVQFQQGQQDVLRAAAAHLAERPREVLY